MVPSFQKPHLLMAPANYTEQVILPVCNIFAGEKKQHYTPLYFTLKRDIISCYPAAAMLWTFFNRTYSIQG
jgi:hypothetical protein